MTFNVSDFLSAAGLAANVILGGFMYRLWQAQDEAKKGYERLIDQRFETARQLTEQSLRATHDRVVFVERSAAETAREIAALREKDHTLEVQVLKALSDLKDVVATKDDLVRLREELNRE